MKFLFALFILLGLVACGVDTDSSGVPSDVPVTPDPDEPEPDEPDSDEPEPDEPDSDEAEPDDPEPIFESDGAVYDENACKSSWATAIPLQDHNENDDRESSDDANGIAVMSYYTETGYQEGSNVVVYYKTITGEAGSTAFRKNGYFDNSQFRIEYDPVWKDEPNNTIYVETPKLNNELKTCYKVIINSDDISNTEQKVYRY